MYGSMRTVSFASRLVMRYRDHEIAVPLDVSMSELNNLITDGAGTDRSSR